MNEFQLIERYFSRPASGDVLTGVGDDGAVTRVPEGHELVTVTDAIVEGVHFLPQTPAAAVAHRSLAVNLSDLAAMGAKPAWASLALSLPAVDENWIAEFASAWFELADRFGVQLIGGDTVSGPLFCSVTAHGLVPQGAAIKRSGAQPGDSLWVSGQPGQAAAGLARLKAGEPAGHPEIHAFLYPEPRVTAGCALRSVAHAMIDVSDGLQADLGHLLAASGCGAEVHGVPLLTAAELGSERADALKLILAGGDDYELLFAVPEGAEADVAEIGRQTGVRLTRFGTVTAEPGIRWADVTEPDLPATAGFDHFGDNP